MEKLGNEGQIRITWIERRWDEGRMKIRIKGKIKTKSFLFISKIIALCRNMTVHFKQFAILSSKVDKHYFNNELTKIISAALLCQPKLLTVMCRYYESLNGQAASYVA